MIDRRYLRIFFFLPRDEIAKPSELRARHRRSRGRTSAYIRAEFLNQRINHALRQIALCRPLSADGGEQSVQPVAFAVIDQLGPPARAISIARSVIHQRPQASVEILDIA